MRHPLLIAGAATLALVLAASPAEADTISLRPVPGTASLDISALAPAPGGDVWFLSRAISPAAGAGCQVGRIRPATGRRTAARLPGGIRCAGGLAAGRAGTVWLTALGADQDAGAVVRTATRGRPRVWPIDGAGVPLELGVVAAASDGAAWVTSLDVTRFVRVEPTGRTRTFAVPDAIGAGGALRALVAGRRGAVWALRAREMLAVSATGKVRRFPFPSGTGPALSLAVGRDGRPRVVAGGAVHVLGPSGFRVTDPGRSRPDRLAADAAGRIRVVAGDARRFGTLTAGGRVRTQALPAGRGPTVPLRAFTAAGDHAYATWTGGLVEVVERPACWVPSLVGETEPDARTALAKAGCVSDVVRDRIAPGRSGVVTRQSAAPDSVLAPNAKVTITVAAPAACVAPVGAREVFRSATAVVYQRTDGSGEAYADERGLWWACLVADPVVRLLESRTNNVFTGGEWIGTTGYAAAGTVLAFARFAGNPRYDVGTWTVEAVDLARGAAAQVVGAVSGPPSGLRVEPDGRTVSWWDGTERRSVPLP